MKPTGKPPACEVLLLLHVLTGEAYGDLREHSEHRLRRQPGRRAEGRACACACAGGHGPVNGGGCLSVTGRFPSRCLPVPAVSPGGHGTLGFN